MNFLGHLYFSKDDVELMHSNLFGDFVKGRNLEIYLPHIQEGIVLHRSIDSFIDQHEAVKELSSLLSPSLPKVSNIAVDIFFDHFLLKNWSKYHSKDSLQFLEEFYTHQIESSNFPIYKFHHMLYYLKQEKWISAYDTIEGIDFACRGVSSRISFPNELVNGAQVLMKNYQEIEEVFQLFMADAIQKFKSDSLQNTL